MVRLELAGERGMHMGILLPLRGYRQLPSDESEGKTTPLVKKLYTPRGIPGPTGHYINTLPLVSQPLTIPCGWSIWSPESPPLHSVKSSH